MPVSSPADSARSALAARPSAKVLIIGAGINGIATFRDLALQGVDVTIVDKGDFVSGASAASSHMIHGGIRYLENGEFRLVKESVTERNGLLKIAPHYVKPLKTTVPMFSALSGVLAAPLRFLTHKQGKAQERGALLIKVGLVLYDSFSRDGGSVPKHEFHGRKKSLKRLPRLNPGLKYTATYYDASMHDPERLALDVLRDGLDTGAHARAANYIEAVGMDADGVRLRNTVTGEEFSFAADVVVNTSGPWTDLTNSALGQASTYMGGTKGSHIVLDHSELLAATGGGEIFFENNDGRIVLIYPLAGRVLIGTTDLEHDMSQPIRTTEDEIDYFFDLVKHVFPDIVVDRSHIVFRFSGVRPLPRHDDEAPGFVSRDYRIESSPLGARPGTLLSLVGGKWTTFRALAEHLSGDILTLLGVPRTVSTEGLAIGGGKGYPATPAAHTVWLAANGDEVGRPRAQALLTRYGTRAGAIIDFLTEAPDAPLSHNPRYTRREIEYLAREESVTHLIDLLLRRTSLAFVGGLTVALLDELVGVLAPVLGWDAATSADEVAQASRELREVHGVDLAATDAVNAL
ncbi:MULTISPECIES: glycerol-3-phosphate dehydrogenase/oxidase [unclassified Cryobacterium]|uniref:glycerol-3-phosphate dehydrogenase/oxidase n=1 Tax=unclassified Cryobacterium TaxID=2649013 RepID=UPI00106C955F|nr:MULTISPECIES: glycerol-3-phosphate dehydrogenase/oxidase [unclassified Cryobacterium]TFC56498.1 glycerol-3-phosphate dehydrogenase/oxidase [Cryobacterium sp. TMB3-1-2]TFC67399.1 glycerol-3-phosphate dehydrogenase/oxidase [Cryobacterium sp. TMB3-15]TFC73450.1 glycerol-3-phosphate dehydrogenase/oxidase [Cryobacterium sp. TMB3-10]TFD37895.1 glycerol-3-phosphate dehydrogenase/oxidase [Cryobacterium sp. TMB3-12]